MLDFMFCQININLIWVLCIQLLFLEVKELLRCDLPLFIREHTFGKLWLTQ